MIAHRKKMFPIYIMIRTQFRRRIKRQGPTFEERIDRQISYSANAITTIQRPLLREQAKATIYGYLEMAWEKQVCLAQRKYTRSIKDEDQVHGTKHKAQKDYPAQRMQRGKIPRPTKLVCNADVQVQCRQKSLKHVSIKYRVQRRV